MRTHGIGQAVAGTVKTSSARGIKKDESNMAPPKKKRKTDPYAKDPVHGDDEEPSRLGSFKADPDTKPNLQFKEEVGTAEMAPPPPPANTRTSTPTMTMTEIDGLYTTNPPPPPHHGPPLLDEDVYAGLNFQFAGQDNYATNPLSNWAFPGDTNYGLNLHHKYSQPLWSTQGSNSMFPQSYATNEGFQHQPTMMQMPGQIKRENPIVLD